MKFDVKKVEETRNKHIALSRSMYFDTLNCLGLDHCDGQRDKTAFVNSAF